MGLKLYKLVARDKGVVATLACEKIEELRDGNKFEVYAGGGRVIALVKLTEDMSIEVVEKKV